MQDRPKHVWSPFEYLLREDPALKGLVVVWVCTAAIVALDIPIAALTHSGIELPAITVGAAALASLGLTARSRRSAKSEAHTSEVEARSTAVEAELRQRLEELEGRIANLEVIDRFEHHLAEKTAARREEAAAAGAGMDRPVRAPVAGAKVAE